VPETVDFRFEGGGRDIMLTNRDYRTLRVDEKTTAGMMAGKTDRNFSSLFLIFTKFISRMIIVNDKIGGTNNTHLRDDKFVRNVGLITRRNEIIPKIWPQMGG
jgi:hypothetical protein